MPYCLQEVTCCFLVSDGYQYSLGYQCYWIEKSGFFFTFSLLWPSILSHYSMPNERMKLQPKILILRGRTNKKKIVFFLLLFLLLISSLTRKFRSFLSDNKLHVLCSLYRSLNSLSDRKERNFWVRLEIAGEKKSEKKKQFCVTSCNFVHS